MLTMASRWRDAIRTLAKFHRVDRHAVGLSTFGKSSGFYDRQVKTFSTISKSQAAAKDKDTGKPVGDIPHFKQMMEFFSDPSQQPKDRATLVHGDYKIDNLVFHKTEPKVIGILDWEMATVGHPLSDLVNLTGPWNWTGNVGLPSGSDSKPQSLQERITFGGATVKPDFIPGVTPGLPSLHECIQWYAAESGYDPSADLGWGNAFGGLRGAVITQGIAARYALRQASGTTAKDYGAQMGPYAEWAWSMVEQLKEKNKKARL
jgi:aminoglycoside phosphotransferase (APT) family kinase protein